MQNGLFLVESVDEPLRRGRCLAGNVYINIYILELLNMYCTDISTLGSGVGEGPENLATYRKNDHD